MREPTADSIDHISAASKRLELAKILAMGILRLRLQQLSQQSDVESEKSVESEKHGLESL